MKFIQKLIVLVTFAVAGTSLFAQGFTMPETTVSWKVSSEQVKDSLYRITFTGNVADGWHTYGVESDMYPTGVEFEQTPGVTFSGGLKEMSQATDYDGMKVFFNTIILSQDFIRTTGDPLEIKGELTWMGCTDTQCASPEYKSFSVKVEQADKAEISAADRPRHFSRLACSLWSL